VFLDLKSEICEIISDMKPANTGDLERCGEPGEPGEEPQQVEEAGGDEAT
jgi:hypothetical protein